MNKQSPITSGVKTIVWDLDGTLLDSFGIYRACLNDVLREKGRPEAPEEILRNNHHGHIEESVAGVLQDMGQEVTADEMAEIMRAFFVLDNAYIKDVDHHLFKDAVDLAERFHKAGMRQVVVTNRPHGVDRGNGSPRNLVANSRLRDVITDVICGDDSAYRKPHRECLEARFGTTLEGLGTILVVGDQFVDAEFANNIGCKAILASRTGAIAHIDRLDGWERYVNVVPSLYDVAV
jgi:phosphoglycolate phosphatase-like HAD superfamily hydrolase